MIRSMQEVLRKRLNECAKAALVQYRHAIVPIYGSTENGVPTHIGSGTLLALAEGHCLLTAAHIIDENKITTLYIGVGQTEELLCDFAITIPPSGDRRQDHHDFALTCLTPDLVARLEGATFIKEAEIGRSVATPVGRAYTCLGFPNSKNKTPPEPANTLQPVLYPYTGSGLKREKVASVASDNDHIVVDFNPKYSRDESGNKVSSIGFRGCSGSAIVDLGNLSDPGTLDKDCEPLAAALVIEMHKDQKAIVGVRPTRILAMIRATKWFDERHSWMSI